MDKTSVPIVFATDDNYVFATCVAIYSIIQNNADDDFHFILLTKNVFSAENNSLISKLQDLCMVTIIYVDKEMVSNVKRTIDYISEATFYRLLIPDLLSGYSKCIYLDSDIVVVNEISELFKVDISDSYICGVSDIQFKQNLDGFKNHCNRIALPYPSKYVNAGVLLMNLDLIRKDNISKCFYENMVKSFPMQDQDIINLCCKKKIKCLDVRYNYFSVYGFFNKNKEMVSSLSLQPADLSDISIIHYAATEKPWLNSKSVFSKFWWDCAKKILPDEFLCKVCALEKERRKLDFDTKTMQLFAEDLPVYIFGYTEFSKTVCDYLVRNRICRVMGFIDNAPAKNGAMYGNLCVSPYRNIADLNGRINVLVIARNRYKEIVSLVKNNDNIAAIKCYSPKSYDYYSVLDFSYFKDELLFICELEGFSNSITNKILDCCLHNKHLPVCYSYLADKYSFPLWLYKKDLDEKRRRINE